MKRKVRFRQITAIAGIALLAGIYLTALVCALIKSPVASVILKIALCGTFFIPVLIYVILMFYKLAHRNDAPEETIFYDERDDPYSNEDLQRDTNK